MRRRWLVTIQDGSLDYKRNPKVWPVMRTKLCFTRAGAGRFVQRQRRSAPSAPSRRFTVSELP